MDQDELRRRGNPSRDETEDQRHDRNLAELLQELRVAAVGIQVVFGFLLAMPFYNRFGELGHGQRALYLVCVLLATLATVLLGGPVAYHRLVFRRHEKGRLVRAANTMAILGLCTVALCLSAVVVLLFSFVEPGPLVPIVAALSVGTFASVWLLMPLLGRRHPDVMDTDESPPGRGQPRAAAGPGGAVREEHNGGEDP